VNKIHPRIISSKGLLRLRKWNCGLYCYSSLMAGSTNVNLRALLLQQPNGRKYECESSGSTARAAEWTEVRMWNFGLYFQSSRMTRSLSTIYPPKNSLFKTHQNTPLCKGVIETVPEFKQRSRQGDKGKRWRIAVCVLNGQRLIWSQVVTILKPHTTNLWQTRVTFSAWAHNKSL
jgi:hypothetical protein